LFFHRIYEDVGLDTRSAIPHPRRSQVAPVESVPLTTGPVYWNLS
jgi:hypothetical protein